MRNRSGRRIRAQKYPGGASSFNLVRVCPKVRFRDTGNANSALRWFTASTTSGKRANQSSLPRRVISRMPKRSWRSMPSSRPGASKRQGGRPQQASPERGLDIRGTYKNGANEAPSRRERFETADGRRYPGDGKGSGGRGEDRLQSRAPHSRDRIHDFVVLERVIMIRDGSASTQLTQKVHS